MTMTNIATPLLNELGASFKGKQCILMLGPRIATVEDNGEEIPLLEGLALDFARKLDAQKIPYDTSANRNLAYISQLYLKERQVSPVDLRDSAKIFVENSTRNRIPEIYAELAKLPVRVIVNTTPDDFIVRALRAVGKSPVVFNFNYEVNSGSARSEQNTRDLESIGVSQPLVFNLFGTYEDVNSLVITEGDQVAFVRNVLEGRSQVPQKILQYFTPQNTYLFFGFNLENWQFRLLLKSLNLGEKTRTLSPQEDNYPISEVTKSYLRHEFNFYFIEARMEEFASEVSQMASTFDTDNVYISYSDEDVGEMNKLLRTLKPLRITNPKLNIWHRGLITEGNIQEQVQAQLQKANIVLPLVSAGYFNDEGIVFEELRMIQDLHRQNKIEVTPIILKPCIWNEIPFFRELAIVPENGAPIVGSENEDEAFRTVAAAFKKKYL